MRVMTWPSERLSDAEVHPPLPEVRLPVDQQLRNGIELPAKVDANRPYRRLVPETRADRISQVAQPDAERLRPDVAAVEEQDRAQTARQGDPQLLAERRHAVATKRQTGRCEGADLEPSPAADACRPAKEILLREGHVL